MEDKQKQIEEMFHEFLEYKFGKCTPETFSYKGLCEHFYKAGYRKIPENAVVLTREEAETIYGTLKANEKFIFDLQEAAMVCKKEMEEAQEVAVKEIEEYVQQVRKETAEKIADWLDNEKGYCGLGYLVKQKFCAEEK